MQYGSLDSSQSPRVAVMIVRQTELGVSWFYLVFANIGRSSKVGVLCLNGCSESAIEREPVRVRGRAAIWRPT